MLKTLTLSLSLAVALGVCSVSKAGGMFHNEAGCTTCGIASPQGPVVSPQTPYASPQGECGSPVCVGECGAKKKCHLFDKFSGMGNKMSCGFNDFCAKMKPKPKQYTYEWVLKKKRVHGHHAPCSAPACETCAIYPSGQGVPSPQGGYSSPVAYGSGQSGYGSGQSGYGSGQSGYGSGQSGYSSPVFGGGSSQAVSNPTGMIRPAPTSTPAPTGDEAPPAPEVAPNAPPAPSAPSAPSLPSNPSVPPAPPATSGLLFSTPSGN